MELSYDPEEAVTRLSRADRVLARVIKQAGPFTHVPEKMQSPFQALMRAIVYQQLNGKAASTILGRVVDLYPRGGLKPQAILATSDEKLRGAGLSRSKVLALKDLAAKTLDSTVPTLARLKKMDDAEIVSRLVQVRGIGPWSVEMLLIFRLGRPDVLPVSDFGVRNGFMLTYGTAKLPAPQEIMEHAECWRPFRSVASWYMWRAVDLARTQALAAKTAPVTRARKKASTG
jgi:DNA-3-methyladenine glycosylase II